MLGAVAIYLLTRSQTDLTGIWQLWVVGDYEVLKPDRAGPNGWLKLQRDGSFSMRTEVHVITNSLTQVTGRYVLSGKTLTLRGWGHSSFDDGYRKWSEDGPFEKRFEVRDNGLVHGALVFRRMGEGSPTAPPRPKPLPSDPSALALIRRVRAKYAGLRTYSDTGTMHSDGSGFEPKETRFQTRFDRAGRFTYQARLIEDGKAWAAFAVWKERGKVWAVCTNDSTIPSETPLREASIFAPPGTNFEIIPELLQPGTFGSDVFRIADEVHVGKPTSIDGHPCITINGLQERKLAISVYIDRHSLLIRRVWESSSNQRIDYRPAANKPIAASDYLTRAKFKRANPN